MRFQVPAEHDQLVVNGRTYKPDENGVVDAPVHEDHGMLRIFGCRPEGEEAPVRVEPTEPPPLPEGYVDPEVVRGLIEENEDQKVAIDTLNKRLEVAAGQFDGLTNQLASARAVEDELRNRIQELEAARADTETATEDTQDATAGASTSGEEKAPETAPAAKKGK